MIEIIPAIDVIDGKCVRLSQGDFDTKIVYNEDPVEVAKSFEGIGIKRLHLVDLDGARTGDVVNLRVLEKIASETKLSVDFGGGIKTDSAIEAVFNAGADFASLGSIAVKDPLKLKEWVNRYGGDKIMLGADVRDGKIAIDGWLTDTDVELYGFLEAQLEAGIRKVFCTDISKDGLLTGPATDLYAGIKSKFPEIELIASGGVSRIEDIFDLDVAGCSGVIIGKAIYEGKISLRNLRIFQ